jgi:Rhodopirellula transposase DDE domain
MSADAEFLGRIGPELALLLPELDEKARRLTLGMVARAAGKGGPGAVAKMTGASWQTVANGAAELGCGDVAAGGRVRRPGAGRKKLADTDPGLVPALLALVEDSSRGDPQSPLAWTAKSAGHLAGELARQGHGCSPQTVWRLLHEQGFSTQASAKVTEGRRHPDRDGQFRYIAGQAREHLAAGEPVISVDAKKKEEVGEYAQGGREWRPKGDPVRVRDHSFGDKQGGHAIPYGVYDVGANTGFVNVGTDHNTAGLAVESIRRWWNLAGKDAYPAAARLLICCDAGGSNGWRNRAWKAGIAQFAQDAGLQVTVCHFPPGTSKWNKIEHRLFSQITLNWRGRPLTSHDVIINTIAATTTSTGLAVTAALDTGACPTRVKVSDEQMRDLETTALTRHSFHGGWNCTFATVPRPAPPEPPAVPCPAAAARAAVAPAVAALASPELTGLSRHDLGALAASLELTWAAAREQRLHLDRGHSRRTRTGPAAPYKYPLHTQLLAAICHHRHGMPYTHIAALLGAHYSTIAGACHAVTALLGPGHPALAPGPVRLRTPADLRDYAAAAGITIPDPPPAGRLRK